jgi:L-iditol 2-dehydrogenase
MKAALLTAVSLFEVVDVPEPALPEDGLILDVRACGLCGSDIRRWKEGPYPGSQDLISGHEVAGVVAAVGGLVQDYAPGDRLAIAPDVHCGKCYYCQHGLYNLCDNLHLVGITPGYSGGFAQRMALSAEVLTNGIVHRIPAGMSDPHAALAEPLSSVLAAHAHANTSLGDTVLVMGAGPIGCLHIVAARARGAVVILSEPSQTRREMASAFAPDLILDPSQEDIVSRVRQFTGGRGADLAICANPVAATHAQAVEAVRKGGRVVLFGGLPKSNPLTSLDANLIHYGEIQVVGSFSYHPTFHQQAIEVISGGKIPADQLITHSFTLDQINVAFNVAASGQALKVMIQY